MLTDILVIDGHDGAGKTSIAQRLDPEYGRYVKPFGGTLGDHIAWLAGKARTSDERWAEVDATARAAVESVLEQHADAERLIFDRHWLSMFTLLPEAYRLAWYPVPHTVLCWTSLDVTLHRLDRRGEALGDVAAHRHYIEAYADLAARYRVPVVDTSELTPEEATAEVVRLAGLTPVARSVGTPRSVGDYPLYDQPV
ncbi:MAG: hypothetical protein M0R75_08855 [Dehalococcoidia bacterium]|nr:hypothetical protein [Dehalococcoidia bacterium]